MSGETGAAVRGAHDLSGLRAVVTGASRGVGRAVARRLAELGARVVIVGRDLASLDLLAREIGASSRRADLCDRAETLALGAALAEDGTDLLVNNAGLSDSAPLERTTDDLWDRTFALDVTAPFLLSRALVPRMVQRGFGRVINIASNAGLTGYAYTSAYGSAKHALVGLTRALAAEVARAGDVTVNAICPGFVDTDMTRASVSRIVEKTGRSEAEAKSALEKMNPQNRLVTVEEVAHLVGFLASPLARGVNGQAIPLDGGQVMK